MIIAVSELFIWADGLIHHTNSTANLFDRRANSPYEDFSEFLHLSFVEQFDGFEFVAFKHG